LKLKNLFLLFIILSVFSCDYFTIKKDTRIPIARVLDNYLYEDELEKLFIEKLSENDSILLVNNFINNWVKQQLLLSKAEINLESKSDELKRLVKKYEEDLFINSYKEAVVQQYLNSEILESDIDKYYAENNENFKLNEELVKLIYIKIGKEVLNQKDLIKLFKSKKNEDLDSLRSKEIFLKSHHLNDSIWVKYSDLITEIPMLKSVDKERLLKKDFFIEKEDSISLYLVTIKDVLKRNNLAPKSYVIPTIKQMILHQRKLLLLRNMEETLVDDANKKQQFEIY